MADSSRLGDLIREKRKAKNLSQTELGDLVEMSQRWVSDLERGATDVPRRSHLHALARVLDIDPARLYVAADLARDESEARKAIAAAPTIDTDDPNDPLRNVVFWEWRKLSPEDLDAVREIVRRLARESE